MRRPLRFSPAVHLVLERFVSSPSKWFHGYTLLTQLDLPSGTLYPVLMRLAEGGWLETKWDVPTRRGRPPRHLYRLVAAAAPEASALLREWRLRGARHTAPRLAT